MSASREFKKNFSKTKLEEIFNTYIKSNSAIGIDKLTYKNFINNKDELIGLINKKVIDGKYKFTPYKEKLILKSRNSLPRLISIPTLRDKLTLKALHLVLESTFPEVRQPLPQECIQEIKNNVHKYDKFIKLDISNFYGNVKHGILFEKLSKKIKKSEITSLIKSAITTPTIQIGDSYEEQIISQGVPQGLSISNKLANIYLHELDLKFEKREDIKYIRFVDDILILCKNTNQKYIYKEIRYDLEGIYNLSLNKEKEKIGCIKKDGFNFLGYAVEDFGGHLPKLTIRDANKKRFENSIVNIFAKYKYSNNMSPEQFLFTINNKITGSISKKVNGDDEREYRYGWLFYFSQMEDTSFLYHLDWFIGDLLNKFNFKQIEHTEIKSFVKAFYEIKYNVKNSTYIHRPDDLTFEDRMQLLIKTFKVPVYNLSNPNSVEKLYKKLVYKPILEYEKDIHSQIS